MYPWLDNLVASGAGALFGAIGAWGIIAFQSWYRRPRLKIDFVGKYPFESVGTRQDGSQRKYINVGITNAGGSTARACKVFVRDIVLEGVKDNETPLESRILMQAKWAPQEAELDSLDIPSGLDFYANIVREEVHDGRSFVIPMFFERLTTGRQFRDHVGVFRMSIVVISENAETVEKTIRLRYNGKPLGLYAEA